MMVFTWTGNTLKARKRGREERKLYPKGLKTNSTLWGMAGLIQVVFKRLIQSSALFWPRLWASRGRHSCCKSISRQGEKVLLLLLVGGDGTLWIPAAPQPQPISLSTTAPFAFWVPLAFPLTPPLYLCAFSLLLSFLIPLTSLHLLLPSLFQAVCDDIRISLDYRGIKSFQARDSWDPGKGRWMVELSLPFPKPLARQVWSSVLPHSHGVSTRG